MNPRTPSIIRVLLIDDQELVRQGIALQIRAEPTMDVVADLDGYDHAIQHVTRAAPHVVMIAADLAATDPFVALAKLRMHWPTIRSMLLVTVVRDALLARAQACAVDGIVTRHDSFAAVRAAIRAVAGGERVYSPRIRSPFGQRVQAVSPGVLEAPNRPKLTRREFEVLHHLAAGRTVKQTARALNLAAPTVDNHKTRLMKKLNVHSGIELTHYAIREGLVSVQ